MFLKKSLQFFRYQYFGTIKQFHLPDLGEKIKEAQVKKWHVKVGDKVEEFQEIADVATDKLHTTIPSEYNGKIHKIFHQVEDNCQVGELFLEIELSDNNQQQQQQKQQEQQEKQQEQQLGYQQIQSLKQSIKIQTDKNRQITSPSVRSLLKQNNLDISQIKGTGDHGMVLKFDVIQYIKQNPLQNVKKIETLENQIIKMTDFQKEMQISMTQSLKIPHFYLMEEIDITEIQEMKKNFTKDLNLKIQHSPFFIKTFSLAMKEYPIINSLYDESNPFQYKQMKEHNISIAINTTEGLVVPNIKQIQNLDMIEIQQEINRLSQNAQIGKLEEKDLFGGTVTISNIGNIGCTYRGPLIKSPQIAVLAIGKIQTLPKYIKIKQKDGTHKLERVPRKIINVSFGGDHRVLNGATAARFIKKWKDLLENPQSIFLDLK